MNRQSVERYLKSYLAARPLFLSLIRAPEASLYAEHLPTKGPVLDVGCGDGYFAKTVFGPVDVGLDVADSRMGEAKNLGVYGKLVTYEGTKFPFGNGSFRTVVSNCVFEHIPDIRLMVREIHRVLKPGGTLMTTVAAKPWEEYLFGKVILGDGYVRYMRKKQVHLNLYTNTEWNRLFRSAGFKIIRQTGYMDRGACRLMDISHYLSVPSLASYVLFKTWVPWPKLTEMYPVSPISRILSRPVDPDKSGAIFYVLGK